MTFPLCSGPSKTSIPLPGSLPTAQRLAPPIPLLTLLRHSGLPAVPPTCQVSSFLRTPCLRPLPQVTVWPPPSCHSDPVEHQLLRPAARTSPSLSHPPHQNRSARKAGPCPPAAQAPTHIGHIEAWAGRPETGDTCREDVSDLGAQLPNLASGVNGRCSFGKLCMTMTWIPTDLRISNF